MGLNLMFVSFEVTIMVTGVSLVGLLTLITISLSSLANVMVCLSNTFAIANKCKIRSDDDDQLLMVRHMNKIA